MKDEYKETEDLAPEAYKPILVDEMDEDSGWKGKPFNPNLIDISMQAQAVSNIVAQIEAGEIDLAPAFQRSGNLWSEGKQSRLIESMLLRIPLPAFYFDVENVADDMGIRQNCWHVIDGLQRLCAIKNFIADIPDNPHALKLVDLEFLHALNGLAFKELPRPYQRIINETQLTVYLVKPGTPVNVKFNIFKRVNTGGVPLTQQEIRHALNQGVAADFLAELASSDHFVRATRGKIHVERMLDREFVNRFLAFYLLERREDEDMDAYYCRALECVASMQDNERENLRRAFYDALDLLYGLFDKWAFCKLDRYPRTKPINKVLFEVMTVSVARLSRNERDRLSRVKGAVDKYVKMLSGDAEFLDLISVSTGDSNRVRRRYEVAREFLTQLMG